MHSPATFHCLADAQLGRLLRGRGLEIGPLQTDIALTHWKSFGDPANVIVFELICADRHRFEGWFASSEDFDGQRARGMLSCPVCSDSKIEKLLTAKIGRPEADAPAGTPSRALPAQSRDLHEMLDYILLKTENVGRDFPSEARRIHRKEVRARSIRGIASGEETRDLLEEGIAVMPLPIPPREDWH
jgi:hypothetical protein